MKMTGHYNMELLVTLPEKGTSLVVICQRIDVLWALGSLFSEVVGLDGCVCHVGGKEQSGNTADFQLLGTANLTSFANIQLNSMTTNHNKYV